MSMSELFSESQKQQFLRMRSTHLAKIIPINAHRFSKHSGVTKVAVTDCVTLFISKGMMTFLVPSSCTVTDRTSSPFQLMVYPVFLQIQQRKIHFHSGVTASVTQGGPLAPPTQRRHCRKLLSWKNSAKSLVLSCAPLDCDVGRSPVAIHRSFQLYREVNLPLLLGYRNSFAETIILGALDGRKPCELRKKPNVH